MARKSGSSPRMRGKQLPIAKMLAHVRIIPAHAGQTVGMVVFPRAQSDHPRACGANVFLAVDMPAEAGSSPRMRGKPGGWVERRHSRRIIPAHAGQTPGSSCSRAGYPDHPRACGANDRHRHQGAPVRGSSPRMRGKPARGLSRKGRPRIIPAHAGQTTWRSCAASNPADHPRACGANPLGQINVSGFAGSSPRMRGKLVLLLGLTNAARIIPAHAGQTPRARSR